MPPHSHADGITMPSPSGYVGGFDGDFNKSNGCAERGMVADARMHCISCALPEKCAKSARRPVRHSVAPIKREPDTPRTASSRIGGTRELGIGPRSMAMGSFTPRARASPPKLSHCSALSSTNASRSSFWGRRAHTAAAIAPPEAPAYVTMFGAHALCLNIFATPRW